MGNAVGGVVNMTGKVISGIGNALTLADTPEEAECDFENIIFLNEHLTKKSKLVIRPETTMIVVHHKK